MSPDPVTLLVAEIKVELERARLPAFESAGVTDDGSSTARRALGSILHDFSNCCERVVRKTAIEMNGGFELKGDRVGRLAHALPSVSNRFATEIQRFIRQIETGSS